MNESKSATITPIQDSQPIPQNRENHVGHEGRVDREALGREVYARRLWYHAIDLGGDLSTRFEEDHQLNIHLRSIDAGNDRICAKLASCLPHDLTGARVLDLGCADGLFSHWAARRGANVVAIERNRYNFERASWLAYALKLTNIEFRWGSVQSEMPDEPFDYVFCVGLIYHLIDPLGALHAINQRCRKKLVFASAVDLSMGDGQPLSRLDRYAMGGHGLWSFNVPMLRQLLVTTGFQIDEEVITGDEPGQHYLAIASASACAPHHIFTEKIDEEFPINVDRRRERVRQVWLSLGRSCDKPIALMGAGTHTPWLMQQIKDLPNVEVACVLDDRLPCDGLVANLPVRRPQDINPAELSAVVISSWHRTEVLWERAKEVFGDKVPIITMYENSSMSNPDRLEAGPT